MMDIEDFESDLEELSSAEDFLDYFGIEYDQSVVHVNRLHILQRFHNNIEELDEMPSEVEQRVVTYAGLLSSAYSDFVVSDAKTEKVFRVFQMNEPVLVTIPFTDLKKQVVQGATEV